MCKEFSLLGPCAECPFKKEGGVRLHPARIEEIVNYMAKDDKTFHCHKTVNRDDEEELDYSDDDGGLDDHNFTPDDNAKICAGWLIFAEKQGILQNNFLMRIAQMAGSLDTSKLINKDAVFDNLDQALAAQKKML